MGQITQTTTQLQTILNDADASNAGNTSISDASDTSATSLKKSGFYSLQASSSNAPSTDRAVVISAVRDTAATGEIRYGQVVITESNTLWWNSDDGGSLGTWYESVGTTATQTLTNKTLTSPVLTTPQINDSAADHQYVFAVANLAADRTVTLPLLTGADTFVFEAHAQTLTNKILTAPVLSGSASAAGSILFKEDTDNGTNAVTLIGPAATADVTVTLPAATDTLVGKATTDTLTNKTITSVVLNTGVSGSAVLDEDNMASNSATKVATQQSIKAYVDAQVDTADSLSEILAIGNTTGGTDIATTTTDKLQFRDPAIYINSSVDGQLDIVADTEIQIAATTIDINGAINASGEIIAASLDISGNIDVDGVTNLDVVDIDGAVDMASTLAVAGVLTGASLDISGDIDVDGTSNLDIVDIDGAVNMATTALVTGVLTTTATQVATGGITSGSDIISDTDSTDSLGSTAVRWLKGWFDTLTAGTLTIGSGSVTDSSGAISFGNENLTTTGTATAASLALATGATVTGVDNGTLGTSATLLATQGAIKTYVDAQVDTADSLAEVLALGNTTGGTDLAVSAGDDITFTDSSKAIFGAGSDLQIYHDGSHSYIEDAGTGALFLKTNYLAIAGANGNQLINAEQGGVVELYHNNAKKLETTSTGIDVTGTVTATGTSVFASLDISADIDVDGTTNLDIVDIDGAVDFASTTAHAGNATFADNAKAILGAGPELEIYSNGTVGYIDTAQLIIANAGHSENIAKFIQAGAVELYHNNTKRIETTSSGLSVYGGAVFNEDSADADFRVESNGNANMLFVDAGNNRVGIGTNAPQRALVVAAADSAGVQTQYINTSTGSASGDGLTVGINASEQAEFWNMENTAMLFATNSVERFRIAADGDATITSGTSFSDGLTIKNTADVHGSVISFFNDSSSPADNDYIGGLIFNETNSAGGTHSFAKIFGIALDITDSTEDGAIAFETSAGGASSSEKMRLGSLGSLTVTPAAGGHAVFNEDGIDADFRVESDGNANMLFVDGGTNRVGIGRNAPASIFEVHIDTNKNIGYSGGQGELGNVPALVAYNDDGSLNDIGLRGTTVRFASASQERLRIDDAGVVANEGSHDADFRVESNGNANMLFVDGGENRVGIGGGAPVTDLDVISTGNTRLLIHSDTDDVGGTSSLLFKVDSQNNDSRIKAGIMFVRDDPGTRGTGSLHFAVDGANDDGSVTTSDSALTIAATGVTTFAGNVIASDRLLVNGATSNAQLSVKGDASLRAQNVQVATNDHIAIGFFNAAGTDVGGIGIGAAGASISLGGNATANTLDHYEEGTWTGTLTGQGAAPNSAQQATGNFTKVGRICNVSIAFSDKDTTGASGGLQVTGLPFTAAHSHFGSYISYGVADYTSGAINTTSWVSAGGTVISFYDNGDSGIWNTTQIVAGGTKYLLLSTTYQTT